MKHRLLVFLTAALIAGALSAAAASTAAAADPALMGGGSFARTVPFVDGQIYAFECHALAPGAQTTTVDSCSMTPDGPIAAPPATASGPFAITHGAVSSNPSVSYTLCWTVSATYADGITQATSGCAGPSSVAAAG
ncbi:MAG TPA: hypothetical protein VGH93_04955 [Solirubrobacteraceae bacterium]